MGFENSGVSQYQTTIVGTTKEKVVHRALRGRPVLLSVSSVLLHCCAEQESIAEPGLKCQSVCP